MKVIIIEDEILSAELLNSFLVKYSEKTRRKIEVLEILETVEGSIEWLSQNTHPDLIFLDIHLHSLLSFEIFNQVNILCPVIFTTAYNQYVIQSFKLNSIAYLLKPLNQKELNEALDKYISLEIFNKSKVMHLWNEMDNLNGTPKYYQVRTGNVYQSISINKIAYFYANNRYVYLRTFENEIRILNKTLKDLKRESSKEFFQVNRQMIVNREAIYQGALKLKLGKAIIELTPKYEKEVKVSRNRLKTFKQWLTT